VSVANGNRAGEGSALNTMAWYLAQLGDYPRALSHCERALVAVQEAAHLHGESAAWDTLGYIHHQLGHYPRAIECYRQSLDLATATVHRYHQAMALVHIGDAYAGARDADEARAAWRRALAILVNLGHADAESVRAKLRDAS
jgi:tetratricopeptide (TPR) repeat protein